MIKAVFFDIDGTTYSHTIHAIPSSTWTALRKLKEEGCKVCICTSRSLAEMCKLPSEFVDFMDGIICLAGAKIFIGKKCVIAHPLFMDEAKKAIQVIEENGLAYRYVTLDDGNYLNVPDKWVQDRFYQLYRMIPESKKYEGEQLFHILYYTQDPAISNKINEICQKNYCINLKLANEILAPNVNKGSAIIECAGYWGIKQDEIAAFGDGYNDIEMLETAKIGIAMGQAGEEVKKAADYVTDDVDHDGIYHACLHFGWIKK